ncbi:MAG: hypothetical protein OER56_17295 [Hyphomicrobiales bacterium]|nr:hypothetical protein [Hyphomicrobiales bacterium]
MTRLAILFLLGCVLVLAQTHEGRADPQILAAVPAGEPLEFVCDGSACEVEFSAICLQPDRHLPQPGTSYKVLTGDLGSIVLSGYSPAGQKISLDPGLLTVASRRGQTAIRFSVAKEVLKQKGLQSVSVDFDRAIALVPQPAQDGSVPQTKADIDKAVSGIRQLGQVWADKNPDNMAVARITVRMTNRLPTSGHVPNAESDRLLQLAVGQEAAISPRALDSSHRLVALCQRRSRYTAMRKCLADIHDQIMRNLNGQYWSILDLGS